MTKQIVFSEVNLKAELSYSKNKVAFITGITGQTGSYLAELLLSKDYEIHGLIRRSSQDIFKNICHIKDRLILHYGDLENEQHLCSLLYEIYPNEIYHLASQSDVRISFDIPEYTANITGLGTLRLLEAYKHFCSKAKFYFAASSEMFGSSPPPQSENTLMIPTSPYGASKLFAFNLCKIYRKSYNLFISSGICFNHESPKRGENFVTRKICKGVANIARGEQNKIHLGNLEAKRDWGYAPQYCEAMHLMLQQEEPDDYVIGTGEAHSIREFLIEAFKYIKINNWEEYVEIDSNLFRPLEVNYLLANPKKAREKLNWEAKIKFKELVQIMMEAELRSD